MLGRNLFTNFTTTGVDFFFSNNKNIDNTGHLCNVVKIPYQSLDLEKSIKLRDRKKKKKTLILSISFKNCVSSSVTIHNVDSS
jgi:hypothetical protein